MEIQYMHEKKLCIVWLCSDESENALLQKALEPTYQANKAGGYRTVVFRSGTREFYANTRDLLSYNRKLLPYNTKTPYHKSSSVEVRTRGQKEFPCSKWLNTE